MMREPKEVLLSNFYLSSSLKIQSVKMNIANMTVLSRQNGTRVKQEEEREENKMKTKNMRKWGSCALRDENDDEQTPTLLLF